MRRTPNLALIQPWDVKDFLRPDRGGDNRQPAPANLPRSRGRPAQVVKETA
jgi:hypothetical protein